MAMKLQLTPKAGEICAHIFENQRAGVSRNLFWILNVELDPIEWDEEEWDCSLAVEWIVWPIQHWRDLDGADLSEVNPEGIECSVYAFGQHHSAQLMRLSLHASSEPTSYLLGASGMAEIDLDGDLIETPFSFSCEVRFTGVVVVPDNIFPKPTSSEELTEVVSTFLSLDGLAKPENQGFRFLFAPQKH
jgi:hypothetical protein